jgi:mRNA-degrading endonuclease RelE of RelBE toxin-antitoxin system
MPGNIVEAMKKASKEYKKLPKWWREQFERNYAELQESWKQPATCNHCGQETKGRCYSCYGG